MIAFFFFSFYVYWFDIKNKGGYLSRPFISKKMSKLIHTLFSLFIFIEIAANIKKNVLSILKLIKNSLHSQW